MSALMQFVAAYIPYQQGERSLYDVLSHLSPVGVLVIVAICCFVVWWFLKKR